MTHKKVFIRCIHACQTRKVDIVRYKNALQNADYTFVSSPEDADIILFWSCSFRADFRDHSLAALQQYELLGKRVVCCGCLPSIEPERLSRSFSGEIYQWKQQDKWFEEAFGVRLENTSYPMIERAIGMTQAEYQKKHPDLMVSYQDQFIKLFISEGCPFHCSYCSEIHAFPRYRSFPLEELIRQSKEVVDKTGERRVVIWGDNPGAYGEDCDSSLPVLIESLYEQISDIQLGISQIHPVYFLKYFDFLMSHIRGKRIFLLDIPIQSASDEILRAMNRSYSKADLWKIFSALQGAGFTETQTHIIMGFPGETTAQFQETVNFINEVSPKYVLLSSYLDLPQAASFQLRGKIGDKEKRRRVLEANRIWGEQGIVSNYDFSERNVEQRFKKQLVYLLDNI